MTCRHSDSINNPSCSSYKSPKEQLQNQEQALADLKKKFNLNDSPDAENYSVLEVSRVGNHLVMKLQYPNCANCAFEGIKVLVFENVSEVDVLRWRRIDPHFREHEEIHDPKVAPSPIARFPASAFDLAVNFARTLLPKKKVYRKVAKGVE